MCHHGDFTGLLSPAALCVISHDNENSALPTFVSVCMANDSHKVRWLVITAIHHSDNATLPPLSCNHQECDPELFLEGLKHQDTWVFHETAAK